MTWLTTDWHQLLPSPWPNIALSLTAIVCGAVIGAEREKQFKPAGLRTMILICLGSAVFTMISLILADAQGDKGRIAAQIVTGIGFLGAGAILHGSGGVRGLTTAATIWVAAAIGMVTGAGYGAAGLGLTAAVLSILIGVTGLEKRYLGPCMFRKIMLTYDDRDGKAAVKIDDILDEYRIKPEARQIECRENGALQLTLTYCNAHKHHKEFLVKFAEMPEIHSIERVQE
ncbi:MAG: MgtC/SapB family protein [Methylococcaceae bacterium]|nr:MgtC/SapB family protein [Methylococcaceae bacterium]